MVCAFCAQGIKKNFNGRNEVKETKVDLDKMEVEVIFKKGKSLTQKRHPENCNRCRVQIYRSPIVDVFQPIYHYSPRRGHSFAVLSPVYLSRSEWGLLWLVLFQLFPNCLAFSI